MQKKFVQASSMAPVTQPVRSQCFETNLLTPLLACESVSDRERVQPRQVAVETQGRSRNGWLKALKEAVC